ncbi:hypothetical protein N0V94_000433 [Neodidymelliopsis sp. IMI 364377]|nr:hypothetical protein N0V94_000433 [Neodidymelliopsis sp. IMI 364377]
MVAFSRITFALAVAGLSSAQSFSGPAPSGFPSDFPTVPGAARPTGGFGGHGGHEGGHDGFAHPTGGFHSGGPPRPSGTGVVGAQRAQQSGEAPFPSGGDFSAFPSGAARPSGHHGHHGKGGKGGNHSRESGAPAPIAASGLERRQQPSGTPPAFSGSFPAPSGGFPSGVAPPQGAKPTGNHGNRPQHSGVPSSLPSQVEQAIAAAVSSLGSKPTHARPSNASGSPPPRPTGVRPTGARPTGARPSGPPPSKPTGFVTSTIRGA